MPKDTKNKPSASRRIKSAIVEAVGRIIRTPKSPDESLGQLFSEVQLKGMYADSKTFPDLVPKKRAKELKKEYELVSQDPHFRLDEFIARHFHTAKSSAIKLPQHPENLTARDHVSWLWPYLKRTTLRPKGSLFALPYSYIVPGGRFDEMFYWDTYFIMLGLMADGDWETIRGMMRNYVFMIDKLGYIPTANRSYFTSRSQPPFFALMVQLTMKRHAKLRVYTEYLPALTREYSFWMKGAKKIKPGEAYARVIKLTDGAILNRYFDNKTTPRPESLREDIETSQKAASEQVFLDLRAAAESGWDFSYRWFNSPTDIHTIHTTDFAPVDLNCLLYIQEKTLADGYRKILQPVVAANYEKRAKSRSEAILEYMWSETEGFFVDYDATSQQKSSILTLAGVFPLYAGIASDEQAAKIAKRLEKNFLKKGGLITTLSETGQQWDAPNGWAPLHWVAVIGLRKYGFDDLADKIKQAWQETIEKTYDDHQKMVEKYNVINTGKLGGGGEYALQDGFGWTNGVYAAFHDNLDIDF